jgi:hypothetical protein
MAVAEHVTELTSSKSLKTNFKRYQEVVIQKTTIQRSWQFAIVRCLKNAKILGCDLAFNLGKY